MSKKLTQVLAGAAMAASLGVWGSSQARGDLNFVLKDMTYGLSNGTVSVTATSVTLGLYATFSGAGVTIGGLNLTRGYFGATASVDATGSLSNAAVGSLFSAPNGATAQIGVSTTLNGDGVTDWGDQPSNTTSNNFFFVDAASHPRPANGSGTGTNSTGTAVVSVLVGTIRLNLTSLGSNGSVVVGYGLSSAMSASDPLFAKTIWAENYSLSTDINGISGVSGVKNEISNPAPANILFTNFKLTFAIPTWSNATLNADWGVNGSLPPSAQGASWSTGQSPDGPGFPVVFANVSAGTAVVSTPHTVGAITFTGSTKHKFIPTSFTGTIGTATAIVTTSGAITLSRGALQNAIIANNSTQDQNLLVPIKLVSSGTVFSTTGAAKLNLGPVTISAGNTLTVSAGSNVTITQLNQVDGGRGNLDVEGHLSLVNDIDPAHPLVSNAANRGKPQNVTILDSMTIGAGGLLNIGNHDLIIRGGGAGMLPTIRNLLASGYTANQDWSGTTGITTSGPENSTGLGAIGYALTSDLVTDFGFNGVFDGVGVNADDILLKYTWTGDTDLNGVVDTNDYGDVDTGFSSGLKGWIFGDLDYNNTVDTNDYGLIDVGFSGANHQLAGGGLQLNSSAVPEPATLGLIGLAAGSMLLRRSKRSR